MDLPTCQKELEDFWPDPCPQASGSWLDAHCQCSIANLTGKVGISHVVACRATRKLHSCTDLELWQCSWGHKLIFGVWKQHAVRRPRNSPGPSECARFSEKITWELLGSCLVQVRWISEQAGVGKEATGKGCWDPPVLLAGVTLYGETMRLCAPGGHQLGRIASLHSLLQCDARLL